MCIRFFYYFKRFFVFDFFFFFQAEDGIRDYKVTGVQTCALPILLIHGVAQRPSVDQYYGLAVAQVGYVQAYILFYFNVLLPAGRGRYPFSLCKNGRRSEERRVGKECRNRGAPGHVKRKKNKYRAS